MHRKQNRKTANTNTGKTNTTTQLVAKNSTQRATHHITKSGKKQKINHKHNIESNTTHKINKTNTTQTGKQQ